MSRARLKICGVAHIDDLAACAAAGVDAIGLNFWTGSKRHVDRATARALVDAWPDGIERIGVFVDDDPGEVAARARALALDWIQPHGARPIADYLALGLPTIWVIRGAPDLEALELPTPTPGRILLDAAVPGFGGAGVQTDWAWARRAVTRLSSVAPVWLAGGITPENAAEALAAVDPAGLDVASGAELPGDPRARKDPTRIAALVDICNNRGADDR